MHCPVGFSASVLVDLLWVTGNLNFVLSQAWSYLNCYMNIEVSEPNAVTVPFETNDFFKI